MNLRERHRFCFHTDGNVDNQTLVQGEGKGEAMFQLTDSCPVGRDHRAEEQLKREHLSDRAKGEEQEKH